MEKVNEGGMIVEENMEEKKERAPLINLEPLTDDKTLVILCATFLAGMAMVLPGMAGADAIVGNVITGLFGVAVGRTMAKGPT